MVVRYKRPVVYDAMYLADLERYRVSYRRLQAKLARDEVQYFNPVLPAKDLVYRELEHVRLGLGRLPETTYSVTPGKVLRLLHEQPTLWLKPVYGSGGRNILYVERIGSTTYRVIAERFFAGRIVRNVDRRDLLRLLRYAMHRRIYLAQENVPLIRTDDGRKIDFRVTVQRTDTGTWTVAAVTARVGGAGAVLTNYHAGGRVVSISHWNDTTTKWLTDLGFDEVQFQRSKKLAVRVARVLQRKRPTLGLLGVDIGATADGRLFVYDFNGRPGRDILTDSEMEGLMWRLAGFARYLLDRQDGDTHGLEDLR